MGADLKIVTVYGHFLIKGARFRALKALVLMFYPILGAHVYGSEFQYPDLCRKVLCAQMANLVTESGGSKGQLSHLRTPGGNTCRLRR